VPLERSEIAEFTDCGPRLRGIDIILLVGNFGSLLENKIDLRNLKSR